MRELFTLWPFVRAQWKRYLPGILFILLTGSNLFIPRLMNHAIETLRSENPRLTLLLLLGLGIIGLAVFRGFFLFLMRLFIGSASRHVEYGVRNAMYEKLSELSPAYYGKNYTGDIMSRCTSDVEALRRVVMPGIMMPVRIAVTFVGALILMLSLNPMMTLVVLGPLCMMTVIMIILGPHINRASRSVMDRLGNLSTIVQEDVSGIRVIKAFSREESEAERFKAEAENYYDSNMRLAKLRGLLRPMLQTIGLLTVLITLYLGGSAIITGEMTLGGFVEFVGLLMMLSWPMVAIGWVIMIWQRGAASMSRINEILQVDPDIKDDGQSVDPGEIEGRVEIRDLTFTYNGGPAVLRNVDLEIEPGKTFAVVGPVGCGKSTIANIVPHLVKVPENRVFVDGVDVNRFKLSALRAAVGYVPQEPLLFSDSVRNNIAFGRMDASVEEIEAAAKAACIHDEIMELPGDYDTRIGERGVTLSGGQKQRVAIARALILDTPILILDDALSAVDTETEERLLANLKAFTRKRTTIIISHRLSTIKDADRIVVLDKGIIVEQGVHDDLIVAGGLYESLYERQLLESELGRNGSNGAGKGGE